MCCLSWNTLYLHFLVWCLFFCTLTYTHRPVVTRYTRRQIIILYTVACVLCTASVTASRVQSSARYKYRVAGYWYRLSPGILPHLTFFHFRAVLLLTSEYDSVFEWCCSPRRTILARAEPSCISCGIRIRITD